MRWAFLRFAILSRRSRRHPRGLGRGRRYEGEREDAGDEDPQHPEGGAGRREAVGLAEGRCVQGLERVQAHESTEEEHRIALKGVPVIKLGVRISGESNPKIVGFRIDSGLILYI